MQATTATMARPEVKWPTTAWANSTNGGRCRRGT
jgi:hypothetical protein